MVMVATCYPPLICLCHVTHSGMQNDWWYFVPCQQRAHPNTKQFNAYATLMSYKHGCGSTQRFPGPCLHWRLIRLFCRMTQSVDAVVILELCPQTIEKVIFFLVIALRDASSCNFSRWNGIAHKSNEPQPRLSQEALSPRHAVVLECLCLTHHRPGTCPR